jgi:hypothetical protein
LRLIPNGQEDAAPRRVNQREAAPPASTCRRRSAPALAGNHHIDLMTAAFGAHEPILPIEHGRFGAIPSSHLGGVWLDLMGAFLTRS